MPTTPMRVAPGMTHADVPDRMRCDHPMRIDVLIQPGIDHDIAVMTPSRYSAPADGKA
jgi:hypothetical protein